MTFSSRLSAAVHALLHLADDGAVRTAEALGASLRMNPVVVMQTMVALRDAGIVRRERKDGGGWLLARHAPEISLRDVHEALGEPALFVPRNRSESAGCVVETAVTAAMTNAFIDAQRLMNERLAATSLADLVVARTSAPPGFEHTDVCS